MRLLYLAFLLGLTLSTTAQSRWRADAEIGGLVTTAEQTPLWLRANQWGTVPVKGSFGTLRAALRREYAPDSTGRAGRFDWAAGVYGVLNQEIGPATRSTTTYLPDAYVKLRWKGVELWGGNRREVVGLGDTLLSAGFMIWSGNALPFPKVQLHTPHFVPLPFTKGFLALRAGYAHGWFTNTYVNGSYLHQKYAYLRLGKPNARLHVTGGLNHQVQWAGNADYLLNSPIAVNGQLPSTLRDYWYVISGSYPEAFRNDRLTEFDGENRVGNHIGSIDFSIDWRRPQGQWQLYHQHIYEDASGLAFQNVPDGLTGLRYQRLANPKARFQVRRATVEWLCTTDQTDDTFDFKARFQGADNYFNHAQYRQGWSYRQRTIGSPLMVPVTELGPTAGSYEKSGFFPNNRLIAWYGAVQGGFTDGPSFLLKGSFSRGFGTFAKPYPTPTEQVSASLLLQWPVGRIPGLRLTTAVALDRGTLLPMNSGGYISLSKHW